MRWLIVIQSYLFLVVVLFSKANYSQPSTSHQIGVDVSWPNCTLSIQPSSFGIVGVNHGLDFASNYCLGMESSMFRSNLSLYVNTGYPGRSYALKYIASPKVCSSTDNTCLAYNYGYNAGKYSTDFAYSQGVVANKWWLDVETINSWTNNPAYNIASLKGEVQAIKDSTRAVQVGFYSTSAQWLDITNNWHNNAADWVASNSNFRQAAIDDCKLGFSSNKVVLVQYIKSLDTDYIC